MTAAMSAMLDVSVPERGFVALILRHSAVTHRVRLQVQPRPAHVSVPERGFVALIPASARRRSARRSLHVDSFSPRAGIRGFDTDEAPYDLSWQCPADEVSVPERGFVALIPSRIQSH